MHYSPLARDGLILVSRITEHVDDSRALRRDVERGLLVAVRRGAFVERVTWDESNSRERHLLRARAALAAASRPCALSGLSAAAVWGMPISNDWPAEVTMLDEWRGGGRSEPGVRKTAAGFATARIGLIDGIRVTSLARTALDVARLSSFSDAVGSVDWALWRKNPRAVTMEDLVAELESLHPRAGGRHLRRVIGFATSLSDSFGESATRAGIHQLGFTPPELQVEFRDAEGLIVPDFFWRETRQAAEFDGKAKYTRVEFTRGDPVEVLWKEKKREDRLRRLGCGVTRILTEHVAQPRRLERLLLDAGIPRGGETTSRRGS
jgi:hypothetical protein